MVLSNGKVAIKGEEKKQETVEKGVEQWVVLGVGRETEGYGR